MNLIHFESSGKDVYLNPDEISSVHDAGYGEFRCIATMKNGQKIQLDASAEKVYNTISEQKTK